MLSTDRRTLIRAASIGSAVAAFAAVAPAFAADSDLYVSAELVSKPEEADALRKLMVDFVAGARKEPGCKHYSLLEDQKRLGRFVTFERWTDQAALDGHMKTPAIEAIVPKLGPILAQPFTQQFLSMVSDG